MEVSRMFGEHPRHRTGAQEVRAPRRELWGEGGARDREEQVQGQRAFRSKLEAALMTRRTERSGVGLLLL